jgi:DNA-binding winged helix-turn-helix (wHTH) protein
VLKLVDLAGRADFNAGPLRVSPGRRLVEGPAGSAHLEPIVMKVFLLLLDARGSVVTRNDLFDQAWGGSIVGDDSLNRAIARVRKIASETAPGSFEIETIPRTGYRVTGDIVDNLIAEMVSPSGSTPRISRRNAMVGAATLVLAGVAGVAVWTTTPRSQGHFSELMRKGNDALAYNPGDGKAAKLFQEAVDLQPTSAAAQGRLAYALAVGLGDRNNLSRNEEDQSGAAAEAAKVSLSLDPADPSAKLAQILLQRSTLDLLQTEDRLRQVLAASPNNIFAMRHLWDLLQSVGRSHEALAIVQRATAIAPLSAACNFPLAQLLWINNRTAEADRIIDRALGVWPEHRGVRFARFTIFAFTNRAKAAFAMLETRDVSPLYPPASAALWRTSLEALDDPTPAKIEIARRANLEAVRKAPRDFARQALLCLPALGQVDAAFETAKLLFAYDINGKSSPDKRNGSSTAWAFVPFLFVPPTEPLRADVRFGALADGLGLTAYWMKRGIRPDYPIAGL